MDINLNALNFKGLSQKAENQGSNYRLPASAYEIKDTVSFGNAKQKYDVEISRTPRGKLQVEIPEGLTKKLDKEVFTFERNDGEEFTGTIKEYLESAVINKKGHAPGYDFYHGSSKEAIAKMKSTGLDHLRNARSYCGPGTYFVPSQGSAMSYGTATVRAIYTGGKDTIFVFEPKFYLPIDENSDIKDFIRDNIQPKKNEDIVDLVLAEYCNKALKDMGVDLLYSSCGCEGAYVAIDDNCVRLL